jgi:Sigma-70 factor, region 1.2
MTLEALPRSRSANGLQTYLRDINASSVLSREDTRILARRIAAGDPTPATTWSGPTSA